MDPLHQQILERLAGDLKGEDFEDCADDLLRDVFPSLVPVRGGGDGGMDGAIADEEGEAFPLICTTRQDFRRNLVESLESYVRRGGTRRKAVFATSQVVTPQARFRLEDAARERGFTLVQVIDRHGMAQRLYWSPRWLQDLGLSGSPSALSAVSPSRRPLLDLEPVGREADLEWLRSTPGDLILAGQPGSGKTFLFVHRIREGWGGLFLVEEDRDKIKRALLAQRPATVIVDDAHLRPEVLAMLRHLREEMAAEFSLVATTWTWERDREEVVAALPGASLRELRLLPRHQILEIFEQAGVRGSDELLRELVDQAANKPGLAATIAHLCKRGAWQEILEGKTLHREVLAAFGPAGEDAEDLLAAFSLGGDRGMRLDPVREFLELSRPSIRRKTAMLAAGGVLGEEQGDALSVSPRRLRTSLLRTVFFPGSGPRTDYLPLLTQTLSLAEAVAEIALVRQTGAPVPEIRELVLRAEHSEESARSAWHLLAGADKEDACWVMEHYPGDLLDIAAALLEQIPAAAIPRLLDRAAAEARARERESRALSLLRSWVQEFHPAQVEEAIGRRESLAQAAKRFLSEGGDLGTGVQAISLALSPNQKGSSRDPGLGRTVKYWSALLPLEDLRRIPDLWKEVKGTIPALDRAALQHLESALWDWMHPSHSVMGAGVSAGAEREMPAFALRVLQDLVPLAQSSPGLRARLVRLASQLGETLPVELDPAFELLYPESYIESEPMKETARQKAIGELAADWARLGPRKTAERLAWYESEAERIGYSWPRGTQELSRRIAESAADPRSWLEAFLERNLAGIFLSPFLERVVQERREGWEQLAERCLELDRYQFAAIDAVLKLRDAPRSLVAKALDRSTAWAETVESLALRRDMPDEVLRAALRHPHWEIALAAAVGEWYAGKERGVRDKFLADWRAAILRARTAESQTGLQHWLGVILANNPELALDWLRARLREADLPTYFLTGPFALAVQALRTEQRGQLLDELPAVPILRSLLPRLVGRDVDLYRRLLARAELADYHLVPLAGKPDEAWSGLAVAALDAGQPPERIASAALSGGHSFTGYGVDYWEGWSQAFAAFENRPLAGLREVARHGREMVGDDLERARSREEQVVLHGI